MRRTDVLEALGFRPRANEGPLHLLGLLVGDQSIGRSVEQDRSRERLCAVGRRGHKRCFVRRRAEHQAAKELEQRSIQRSEVVEAKAGDHCLDVVELLLAGEQRERRACGATEKHAFACDSGLPLGVARRGADGVFDRFALLGKLDAASASERVVRRVHLPAAREKVRRDGSRRLHVARAGGEAATVNHQHPTLVGVVRLVDVHERRPCAPPARLVLKSSRRQRENVRLTEPQCSDGLERAGERGECGRPHGGIMAADLDSERPSCCAFAMSVFRVEQDGHVATLFLANPSRRNAMGPAFFEELPKVVAQLDADEAVRAVVVAADGPQFSTGLDLVQMAPALGSALLDGGLAKERLELLRLVGRLRAGFDAIAASNKPFIAAIHGLCIGGGLDLVAACDVRLAAKSARFGIRETKIAIVADMGSLQRLQAVVPRGHLREMALTGKDISSERALRIGLVNDLFESEVDVLQAAREVAREAAGNAPLVVQGTKAVLRVTEEQGERAGLEYVALWNAAHLASNDLKEAMSAFIEKREPRFTGS